MGHVVAMTVDGIAMVGMDTVAGKFAHEIAGAMFNVIEDANTY